jgi:hypothetical protein
VSRPRGNRTHHFAWKGRNPATDPFRGPNEKARCLASHRARDSARGMSAAGRHVRKG